MHALLPVQLGLILQLLFSHFLLDSIQLFFLSLANGLSSSLAICGLFQDLYLSQFIKLLLLIRSHARSHYDDLVLGGLANFRRECAPSVKILSRPISQGVCVRHSRRIFVLI